MFGGMASPRRRLLLVITVAAAAAATQCTRSSPEAEQSTRDRHAHAADSDYFNAEFEVETLPHHFGQNPSWTQDSRVLSNEDVPGQGIQIHRSDLDGGDPQCLTCGQEAPNTFPLERPGGGWVLFCSWRLRQPRLGVPCLGGYGSDLFVMRSDGSDVTPLTSPRPDEASVAVDNYHPAWSPDGSILLWTHVVYLPAAMGGAQWTIRMADFDPGGTGSAPRLRNERIVEPAGSYAYETQTWAPDGSGYLFTRAGGRDPDGWMNTELYFTRIAGHGATLDEPVTERLTDGHSAWDEQAAFTPDMSAVVFMSSRGHPTRYEAMVSAARAVDFDTDLPNDLFGPMFFFAIGDRQFATELYIMDIRTRLVRRLTFDGAVIPEFEFDSSGHRILWGQGAGASSRVGTFHLDRPTGRVRGTPLENPVRTRVGGLGITGQSVAPTVAAASVRFQQELGRLQREVAVGYGLTPDPGSGSPGR